MKLIKSLLISAAVSVALTGVTAAQVVGVASGQAGSLGHSTGQAVAKILNQEGGIQARTQPLSGSTAYIPLINNGELEFGFANAVDADFAVTGTGSWDGQAKENLRLIGVMFPLKTGLMVPADAGIKSIADLKTHAGDLRIASEYTGSQIIRYYVTGALANGGISYDDFNKVPVSNFVKGIEALGGGLVDVALVSLNSGAGKKANAQLSRRGGLQYVSLDMSEEATSRFNAELAAAKIVSLEANENIPGLIEGANIIQIPWLMFTHKDAGDELIYKVTKTIAENNDKLAKSFGAFRGGKPAAMGSTNVMPYHSGALRYYKEAGITVSE